MQRRLFWIYKVSDGKVAHHSPIRAFEAEQAVGCFVSLVIKQGWRKGEFFASKVGPETAGETSAMETVETPHQTDFGFSTAYYLL